MTRRGDPTHTFPWEFFPETARSEGTFPSVEQVCQAFASAGFSRDALEQVPETLISLPEFLDQADNFRRADTIMRGLTEEEFLRGQGTAPLRRSERRAGNSPGDQNQLA